MKDKNILVIGGNGKTGRKVVERLNKLGFNVRIGSRTANPKFDWKDETTWEKSLKDIDLVYLTYQPDLAVPGARQDIKEFSSLAIKSGVQKIVLLSGKGEKEAELSEQTIMNSGADWTIVRASWFNQNFSESFLLDPILDGQVALPKAEALIPFVDTDDIADVVVEALLNNLHSSKVYELTGPRQLTFKEVINEISKVTDRNIEFNSITMHEYTQMLKEYKVPDDFIWLIEYLFTEVLISSNSIISNDVEKILGRKPKDFTEYAKETASTGIWNSLN